VIKPADEDYLFDTSDFDNVISVCCQWYWVAANPMLSVVLGSCQSYHSSVTLFVMCL